MLSLQQLNPVTCLAALWQKLERSLYLATQVVWRCVKLVLSIQELLHGCKQDNCCFLRAWNTTSATVAKLGGSTIKVH